MRQALLVHPSTCGGGIGGEREREGACGGAGGCSFRGDGSKDGAESERENDGEGEAEGLRQGDTESAGEIEICAE